MKRFFWIFLLCVAAFHVNNTALLPDIMECRNLVTAREMVSDDAWLVPTMNGNLRLEKPPLPTWVAGAIEKVSPDNFAAQRMAAGVTGMLWVLFFYLMAKRLTRRDDYAFIATLVFLTCYQIVLMGRTATWDIYCHAFMMGAIFFLWRAFYDDEVEGKHTPLFHFLGAGVFMGLSFLSKGPVSFYALLLPFLIAALSYQRPNMRGKWSGMAVMVIVCLVISAWWYLYLRIFHADEMQAVFHKETGAWINRNVRPFWYYWRFFTETGVWAILMLAALYIPYWKKQLAWKKEYLFAITWVLSALVLLSLMPEKKMRYLLPMMVPCALSVAFILLHLRQENNKVNRILLWLNGGVVALVCWGLPIALFVLKLNETALNAFQTVAAVIIFPLIGLWVIYAVRKNNVNGFVYGVVAIFVAAECLLMGAIGQTLGNPHFRSIEETRKLKTLDGIPFYSPADEELRIEMVYAAHRKILPLELTDSAKLISSLPCVVVSQKPIDQAIPPRLLHLLKTEHIGDYDDNRLPKHSRHYNTLFLNHVTLLKQK